MIGQEHTYIFFKNVLYNQTRIYLYIFPKYFVRLDKNRYFVWSDKIIFIYALKVFHMVRQKYIYISFKNVPYG